MNEPHAIQRARERYGLTLSVGQLRALEKRVTPQNRFKVMDKGAIHLLPWDGVVLVAAVVNDNGYPCITTFMPPDFFAPKAALNWKRQNAGTAHRGGRDRRKRR